MRPVNVAAALGAAALLATAGGCMSLPWAPTEKVYTSSAHGYRVELPLGWVRYTRDPDQDLVVTRDGPQLQLIFIERVPVNQELRNTKKKLAKGMIPQEAAEVLLDNMASNDKITSFAVKENAPARIAGKPGFKATVTYKTKDGLGMRSIVYGTLAGENLYVIRYAAPQRHYFEKDLAAFERVAKSFALGS
jgi:PsbP